jgi:hypothetical protein
VTDLTISPAPTSGKRRPKDPRTIPLRDGDEGWCPRGNALMSERWFHQHFVKTGLVPHLAWFYRLAKASVPKASSPKWSPFLLRVIVAADLSVCRRSKRDSRDVTINNGIHWHGLAQVNPLTSKLDVTLDLHIKANPTKYHLGSIQEIDATPITHRPRHVTRYGMKGLERRQFSIDEVLIFPRSIGELP